MKIEVLFPEICNLYGDLANIRYLKESVPELELVETHLTDEPCFAMASDGKFEMPDMIYMGTMTENSQLLVIDKLGKYIDTINKCIDNGAHFLITGNAIEIFGKEIIEDDVKVADGLGLFDIQAKRSSRTRYNSLYVGDFAANSSDEPIKIVGFKSVFGYSFGAGTENNVFDTVLGYGTNPEIKKEGIRKNNFIATYVIGPLMVLNPLFTKWYIKNAFDIDAEPAYNEAAMDAYNTRLEEYLTPGKGWTY